MKARPGKILDRNGIAAVQKAARAKKMNKVFRVLCLSNTNPPHQLPMDKPSKITPIAEVQV